MKNKTVVKPDDPLWVDMMKLAGTQNIADMTHYSREQVTKWCTEGKVVAVKIGGRWVAHLDSVKEYLKNVD